MIIATAGHVDHGKTTLIRALTGTDPTRHPEARRRGMTIDLGYALLAAPRPADPALFLVDVPGHERFIQNMICGIAGVDAVLLVIAADDGPMPQTLEHLRLLDLLGIDQGVIALTRIDRCDQAQRMRTHSALQALSASPLIARAPVIEVCAPDGRGIDLLRQTLFSLSGSRRAGSVSQRFRMTVDRSFTIAGAGLVVTGTVFAGRVALGETVHALHVDLPARVRSIQIQHRRAEFASAGERCALNLASTSLTPSVIGRGEWLVGSMQSPVSRRIHVRLFGADGRLTPLLHSPRQNLRLHLGSCEVGTRVSVIAGDRSAQGSSDRAGMFAQLSLDSPLGSVLGERFILRDPAARITVGGGVVVDANPPQRLPAGVSRERWLSAMEMPDCHVSLCELAKLSPQGIELDRFCANRNLDRSAASLLIDWDELVRVDSSSGPQVFSRVGWHSLVRRVIERLEHWHASEPEAAGMPLRALFRPLLPAVSVPLTERIANRLISEGVLAHSPIGPRLPLHQPRFPEPDETLWATLESEMASSGLRSPSALDLARRLTVPRHQVLALLERADRMGRAVQIAQSRFFLPGVLDGCRELLRDLSNNGERDLTAAQLRDATGLGRNLCVELLEYFDRTGVLRREGDAHQWIPTGPGGSPDALIHRCGAS